MLSGEQRHGSHTGSLPILRDTVPVELFRGPLDGLYANVTVEEDGAPPDERYFVSLYGDVKYRLTSRCASKGIFHYMLAG